MIRKPHKIEIVRKVLQNTNREKRARIMGMGVITQTICDGGLSSINIHQNKKDLELTNNNIRYLLHRGYI